VQHLSSACPCQKRKTITTEGRPEIKEEEIKKIKQVRSFTGLCDALQLPFLKTQ